MDRVIKGYQDVTNTDVTCRFWPHSKSPFAKTLSISVLHSLEHLLKCRDPLSTGSFLCRRETSFTFISKLIRIGMRESITDGWGSSPAPTSRYAGSVSFSGKAQTCSEHHLSNLRFVSSFPVISLLSALFHHLFFSHRFSASSSCWEGSAQKTGTSTGSGIRRSHRQV